MLKVVLAMVVVVVLSPFATEACMRPAMDERAVQWSNAIVEAKLASIGPEMKLGAIQERRGVIGALGQATITYVSRVYTFDVIRTLDGAPKAGDKVSVVRLIAKAEEPPLSAEGGNASGLPGGCPTYLVPESVGKTFVLMVRALSEFKAVVPNGVSQPDVKNGMWIVHIEPKEAVTATTMEQLTTTITTVRETERQIDPARVDHLISQIQAAPTDAQAGPSMRALERIGVKIMPTVQQAAIKVNGPARSRLLQVVSDLTPPEPINTMEMVKVETK